MGIVLEQTEPPAPVLGALPFPAPPLQPSPEGVGGGEREGIRRCPHFQAAAQSPPPSPWRLPLSSLDFSVNAFLCLAGGCFPLLPPRKAPAPQPGVEAMLGCPLPTSFPEQPPTNRSPR